ncbi:copia protein [Tanacetum coccineum]|uniref:Copia protein n=1 Tax=Tanacetum coccineum TaxID=301880 RepID=A0ABQ5E3E7_9ASTR
MSTTVLPSTKERQHKSSYKCITTCDTPFPESSPFTLQWNFLSYFNQKRLITSITPWGIQMTLAVSGSCGLVPINKIPYKNYVWERANISHLKPFGCHVTILTPVTTWENLREKLMKVLLLDKTKISGLVIMSGTLTIDYLTDSLSYTHFKTSSTCQILKNKRDARGIVVRNKARLVAQGHRQEEGIDYDEVFAPVARIEAIRLFLAFASYMGFMVYPHRCKSAFICGNDEEVMLTQPKGIEDPHFPKQCLQSCESFYGLHQAPRHGELIMFLRINKLSKSLMGNLYQPRQIHDSFPHVFIALRRNIYVAVIAWFLTPVTSPLPPI